MANRIELASEKSCMGLCSSKQVVIEGLFVTTREEGCCTTVENVIPLASVDDVTMVNPNSCWHYCCKCLCCGLTCRNGRPTCDCSCSDAVMHISWAGMKTVAIEKVDNPEAIFEQLKARLHVAKGGPVRQK